LLMPWGGWGLLLRGMFVLIFSQSYRGSQRFRARFASSPCEGCSEGVFPFCRDNRQRLVALVKELRTRARPEDQGFVDFAGALAGLQEIGAGIEVVSLRVVLQSNPRGRTEQFEKLAE